MSFPDVELSQRLAQRQRPEGRAVMHQSWKQLLFLHWRFDPAVVQSILPPGLHVDLFDNSAWVAVVPFLMRNVRPTWLPSVPYLSNFLELNVRTYAVNEEGTPGVWFTSLSANRLPAVQGARWLFHLPYVWARMTAATGPDGKVDYQCRRFSDSEKRVSNFSYTPQGSCATAVPGTLEFFLLERYLLFAQRPDQKILTGRVFHTPYPVQSAEVHTFDTRMIECDGFAVPGRPPDHIAYSPGVDVEVFPLQS
ncbi:YqjF family protein [Planctomicrobium sp. SH661]|uniref:YqjF family protein n=1 Tax=Planctomicrobium sp. SH661 TaxID=3448124 RepID=UPI003F5B628D